MSETTTTMNNAVFKRRPSEADLELLRLVQDVPKMPIHMAVGCAMLNVLLSGTGTIVSGFFGVPGGKDKTQIFIGVFQMLMATFVFGYFISWYWAYLIVEKSLVPEQPKTTGWVADPELAMSGGAVSAKEINIVDVDGMRDKSGDDF